MQLAELFQEKEVIEKSWDKALEEAENAPSNYSAKPFNDQADRIERDLDELEKEIEEKKVEAGVSGNFKDDEKETAFMVNDNGNNKGNDNSISVFDKGTDDDN